MVEIENQIPSPFFNNNPTFKNRLQPGEAFSSYARAITLVFFQVDLMLGDIFGLFVLQFHHRWQELANAGLILELAQQG